MEYLNIFSEPHGGFGFYCDMTFRQEISDVKFAVQQMTKPKRKFQGLEDGALDIFDISPDIQRQVLGILPTKRLKEEKKEDVIEVCKIINSFMLFYKYFNLDQMM